MRPRSLLFIPAFGLILACGAADGRESNDHERARAAQQAGEIRPLADILREVERRYLGRVIEIELEQEDGVWVYEFRLLPPTGRVFELEFDATTGTLLRSKGPVQERR